MGRFLVLAVVFAGGGWLLVNGVGLSALDPRGVGTRVEGRAVVRSADDVEARFTRVGSLDETYMLFGGDAARRRNALTHVTAAGLALRHARLIAASHPDFHLCKSPGAAQAQRLTENLAFVAADRAARNTLAEAVALFEERLGQGGERTCIHVRGAPLALDAVHVGPDRRDVTGEIAPMLRSMQLVLAERVEIRDCRPLLR